MRHVRASGWAGGPAGQRVRVRAHVLAVVRCMARVQLGSHPIKPNTRLMHGSRIAIDGCTRAAAGAAAAAPNENEGDGASERGKKHTTSQMR